MDTLITIVFSGLPKLKKSNYRLSIENSKAPATHENFTVKKLLDLGLVSAIERTTSIVVIFEG